MQRATKWELLRVPGLGTRSAERIVAARRHGHLDLIQLKKMGVVTRRAAPFITCAGRYKSPHSIDDVALRVKLIDSSVQGQLF